MADTPVQVQNGQVAQTSPAPSAPGTQNTPQTSPQQSPTNPSAPGANGAASEGANGSTTPDAQEQYRKYVKAFFPDVKFGDEQAQAQVENLRQAALSPEDIDRIVEQRIAQRMAGAQQTPTPQTLQQQVNSLAPQEKETFLGLVRDGKNEEAERYLLTQLRSTMAPDIEQRVQQQVLNQVLTLNRAEKEVSKFESEFYAPAQNADLAPWKQNIDLYAKDLMLGLVRAGKVKDVDTYIDAHKACVVQAANDLRQKISGLRGQGKEEAMTRSREVLAQTPMVPGQIASRSDASDNNAQPRTASDYIAERQRKMATQRGLFRQA